MASRTLSISVSGLEPAVSLKNDPTTASASVQTALDAVDAAITVAEADGATPTQQHVTDIRTAFSAVSLSGVSSSIAGTISITVDMSAIGNMNKLKAALDAIYRYFDGAGVAKG